MASSHTPCCFRFFPIVFLALVATAPAVAGESRWWMREGKGDQLCETLYKELQKYRPEDLGSCTGSVALALPGMKEMDGWKELDPREHKELFKKILQYQALGVEAYFGKWPEDAELRRGARENAKQKTISDEFLEKRHQEFVSGGGRMRVKTLQLFRHPLHRPDITYEQPQTLLELRYYKPTTMVCPKAPSLNDPVRTFFITANLSGPDPEILDGERSHAEVAQLVLYKNTTYLMATGPVGGVTLYRESNYQDLKRTCEIQRR